MKPFTQWFADENLAASSFLILGKGPSFERLGEFDISAHKTVAINHTIEHLPHADVASVIDLDVLKKCGDLIEQRAKFLLMPRFPHTHANTDQGQPTKPLEGYFEEFPVLKRLSEAGRLVFYALSGGPKVDGMEGIDAAFSAEAVVRVLALGGVKTIRFLGVDGGHGYASQFAGMAKETHLANGRDSFDAQLDGIGKTIWKYNLDAASLTSDAPVRIFIGTDRSQLLGAKVLEYSVRRRCLISPVFDTMQGVVPPTPKDPKNHQRTEFSFRRFAIPSLCGFKGKAVYLDADMQVFKDFRGLWDTPFGDATVLAAPSSAPGKRPSQFSVLLLDCQRLHWDLDEIVRGFDEGKYDYEKLMKHLSIVPPEQVQEKLSPNWNSLEQYKPGETGLIHYTDMPTQPWVFARNPNGDLWVECLSDAIRDGYVSMDEVQKGVDDGYARPSLIAQLQMPKKGWKVFTQTKARLLDAKFKPHQALQQRLAAA